jgi:hypothetical protein
LAHDPLDVIAEVLGEPADEMRNPANAEYLCPFIDSRCTKQGHANTAPLPICSLYRRGTRAKGAPPICTCPERFYEADLREDVIRECWVGAKPKNPVVVREVGMQKFGNVDLVVADITEKPVVSVSRFLPVELQAVDITGSVVPYYEALTASKKLTKGHQYNFNWANVRKRFISQLVAKGYYCHQWGTRIVAVVQEELFESFERHAKLPETKLSQSNIVFMLYQFGLREGRWEFEWKRIVPTTHNSVMSAILYESPPSKAAFEEKILKRLSG